MLKAGLLLLGLVLLLTPAIARADRLVLQDGSILVGDITAESDTFVSIDLGRPGVSLTVERRVKREQIKTWYRAPREGPAYAMIPIIGEIGVDVTADAVKAGLDEVRRARPAYIIL